ncbi:substrate-binding domain-containing protein [Streptomyces sp. NPDC002553]|uniref:sugar ABC transporter substrate-binding protein n=1 Tax=Streptomyces sp. NPDC002553 TaxID=3154417 RepID=UPI00331B4563
MRARARHLAAALAAALMTLSLASCGGEEQSRADGFAVGLLLPNRVTPRWENHDKPLIEKRVKELCPSCTIEHANAEGDVTRQRQQMLSMITKGVKVLILDAADTRALRSSIQEARKAGVPVLAYDRLAEGPISGFVSFDGGHIGRLQGEALLGAVDAKRPTGTAGPADKASVVMMNGDPTSANAAWFRKGALSVLTGRVRIARSYDTEGWTAQNAHADMTAALAALGAARIDGVLAANDALASGVISALKSAGVAELPPVTGQDADLDAVQRIVKGEQYMTVYKPFEKEADAAAAMAVALGRGQDLSKVATTTIDSPTDQDIPAVLLNATPVTARTVKRALVDSGAYTVAQICTRQLRTACDRAGLLD